MIDAVDGVPAEPNAGFQLSAYLRALATCGEALLFCACASASFADTHAGFASTGMLRFGSPFATSASLDSRVVSLRSGTDSLLFARPPAGGALTSLGVARNYRHDGYDALLIGLRVTSSAQRAVNVYFGGATADTIPDLSLTSAESGDLFGAAVVGLGDVNGDGFGDFAVGAPAADAGRGKVYVYLGAASPSTTPAEVLSGNAPGDLFGTAITPTDRLNGDAYGDFAVGAPGAAAGAGSVYLFAGGTTLPNAPSAVLTGDSPAGYRGSAQFASVLAGGADLDRDQHDDLVVAAPGRDGGKGSVWLYRGGAAFPSAPTLRWDGVTAFDRFGAALALDSLQAAWTNADLAIGSPGAARGAGKVSVFAGGPALSTTPGLEFTGFRADDRLGTSIAISRNSSQALSGTLLMGAPFRDDPTLSAGAVYRFGATPLLGVEVAAFVEADGASLREGQFTSSRPRLDLRLQNAAGIDLASSRITLDSFDVGHQAILRPASIQGGANVTGGAGLELTPDLADGDHVLRAHLISTTHDASGSIEVHFRVAARLAILAPRVWPQPARGIAHLGFTLTRAAGYVFEIYDLQGRRVLLRTVTQGTPDSNELEWDGAADGGRASSGIFFYTLTARYQGEQSKVHGRVVLVR
jgi:hypothetical protein